MSGSRWIFGTRLGLEVPDEGAHVVELGRADPAGATLKLKLPQKAKTIPKNNIDAIPTILNNPFFILG